MLLPLGDYLYPSIREVLHLTIDSQVHRSVLHCFSETTVMHRSFYKGMDSYFRAYQDILASLRIGVICLLIGVIKHRIEIPMLLSAPHDLLLSL